VRTAVALASVALIVSVAGRTAFFVLACVVVLTSLFELFDALVQSGRRPSMPFGLACGLGMMLAPWFHRPALVAVVIAATVSGSFLLALRPGRGERPASDAAWTVLGVAWIGGGGAAATSILILEDGLLIVIAFVAAIAGGDIGAYFAGTRFGAHKMAPSVSPGKSWEGYAGGLACALAGGAALGAFMTPLSIVEGAGLGAICGLFGPAGDVIESLVKREIGIKDSGRLLPGHGGFLDRTDAMIFCAPLVLAYAYLITGSSPQ